MPGRRKGRQVAVQMLYQWDITQQPADEVIDSFRLLGEPPVEVGAFARRLFIGTLAHVEAIDQWISGQAEHWRLTRMAVVDRNILRLAIYELLYEETPHKVIINEALEVTKKFSTPEAVQFINGVLDAVRLKIESTKEAR